MGLIKYAAAKANTAFILDYVLYVIGIPKILGYFYIMIRNSSDYGEGYVKS
jgi:hypothetical protein